MITCQKRLAVYTVRGKINPERPKEDGHNSFNPVWPGQAQPMLSIITPKNISVLYSCSHNTTFSPVSIIVSFIG